MPFQIDQKALEALPGPERARAEEIYAALLKKRRRDPLAFYVPHVKQRHFHSFTAQTKCFFGGNQSGKTTGGLADDIIQAVDRDALPPHLLPYKKFEPPFLCRIMAESYKVMEMVVLEKLKELLPVDQLVGGQWEKAFDSKTQVLYFQNGSKFNFATYQTDVSALQGVTLDRVHFDEEPPWMVFKESRMRVMARSGDLLFTMTPTEGLTWTYDFLWHNRGDQVEKDVYHGQNKQVVVVDMDDNPILSHEDKELALEGLSEEERAARKRGHFVALHGLIYGDFSRKRHLVPHRPELPENVNVVVGIDPGIGKRAAVIWLYLTPDDQMVVFEEASLPGATARQVCEVIKTFNAKHEITPLYYVIDPAARNKNHQTGRSDQMEYADHGIVTIAGQNSVTAGINRVKERFQTDRLYVMSHCETLIGELEKYRWKPPPRSEEDGKAQPVKKDDHGVDALRYAVMSRPYLPTVEVNRAENQLERLMREDRERFSPNSNPDEINYGQLGGLAA